MVKHDDYVSDEYKEVENLQTDTLSNISDKTDIEKITASNYIRPNNEKITHLGFKDEDFLFEYTFDQLDEPDTYKHIVDDMEVNEVDRLIINGKVPSEELIRVVKLAQKLNKPFTIVSDPFFKGELALGLVRKHM